MQTAFTPPPPSQPFVNLKARATIGAKFFLLFTLAVLMSLPGFYLNSLANDRAAARGVAASDSSTAAQQPHTVLGIRLADSYRSTQRSLKYITLFLGLVFLTYFIFEMTTGKSVHLGQYALVGVAQTIFYLLLLSLSERPHIGFDLAFLIAGAATVLLFSLNTEWVFASRRLGLRALAVFSLLYSFIYVLLRLEDYALLIGASAAFIAVAATMYFTRSIDWYSAGGNPSTPPTAPTPAPIFRDSILE
jgi:inner membrane protein involved in colicin E2 resistance